ncbi:MAG: hypothetical protein KH704_13575, partial [Clostridiales bacterium]|nr:hypothetical protein [Clostridiales bacterium]
LQRQISSAVVTKQSGYATKQTGYFWTKQLGLNINRYALKNGVITKEIYKRMEISIIQKYGTKFS